MEPHKDMDAYLVQEEPYYLPLADETEVFRAAYAARLPVMLKGPTGCGKTRFVEAMAHLLGRPLVTVSCHEDLFASDLVGRFLLYEDQTRWADGPLTLAVRFGAILYLDEVVEARKDTTVVIHPLADDRRTLVIEKTGEVVSAHPDFQLVVSYNPGYQSVMKDLKQSTRQRFVGMLFSYPGPEKEEEIIIHETGIERDWARSLVSLGGKIRNLKDQGLAEGASTRLLIHAAHLMNRGVSPESALRHALAHPLTDDVSLSETISELIADMF